MAKVQILEKLYDGVITEDEFHKIVEEQYSGE